jgi:2-polyprenyl-3-methyl-5-hydroxy-6-metoxy-1,4-benzoquinol methylase
MPLSFWEYLRLGSPQWRGQSGLAQRLIWFMLGTPDMHTRIRNAHVCNVVARLNLPEGTRVLDTGCGRAVSLFYLAGQHPDWQCAGLELDDEMVIPAQRAVTAGNWQNITIRKTAVEELTEENTFDVALCMEILEHVRDDVGLLRRIYRALKPGGWLIVTAPLRRKQQWRWLPFFAEHDVKGEFGHVRDEYSEDELKECLTAAGFVLREFHQIFGKRAEVTFELNNLFWTIKPLRRIMAILMYPLAVLLGYKDTLVYQARGNSFLIVGQRV